MDVKQLEVVEWFKSMSLAPKTKSHIRAILHMLFEKAMLWDFIAAQRNQIALVKVKGSSKGLRQLVVLTPEQVLALLSLLKGAYRMMVLVALCTGLRVSEICLCGGSISTSMPDAFSFSDL